MLRPLWIAAQFLTRLPLPSPPNLYPRDVGHSLVAYPVIGLGIGVLLAAVGVLFAHYTTAFLAAAVVVALWALVTGGLHLDGLADSADAWHGGQGDPERTLKIMQDPRAGPAGITALVGVLLIKVAAVTFLLELGWWQALVFAPVLGRCALVLLMAWTRYVRPDGLGAALAAHAPRTVASLTAAGFAAAGALWLGFAGLVSLLAAALLTVLLQHQMVHRIGGTTGDTAGALTELTEALCLLVLALLIPM